MRLTISFLFALPTARENQDQGWGGQPFLPIAASRRRLLRVLPRGCRGRAMLWPHGIWDDRAGLRAKVRSKVGGFGGSAVSWLPFWQRTVASGSAKAVHRPRSLAPPLDQGYQGQRGAQRGTDAGTRGIVGIFLAASPPLPGSISQLK